MPESPGYARILKRVLNDKKRVRNQAALAELLKVTPQTVSRVCKHGGHFGLKENVRLAKLANEHPSVVLRLSGSKQQIAFAEQLESVESVYGPSNLSGDLRELIEILTDLPGDVRTALLKVLKFALSRNAGRRGAPSKRSSAKASVRPLPKRSTVDE